MFWFLVFRFFYSWFFEVFDWVGCCLFFVVNGLFFGFGNCFVGVLFVLNYGLGYDEVGVDDYVE